MKRLAALAAILLFAISAFGQAFAANPVRTIRVGALRGPTGIGMIQLFEAPPKLPQGDSLALELVASADAMAAKLVAGELDAAVLPVNLAAKLHASGLPYRMVAVVGMGMVSVITTDPAIRSFADLKDREIYVAGQGATPEYVLRAIARKRGLEPDKDLRLAFQLPPPEMAAAFVSGRIATVVLPEPFATQALLGNPRARVPFSLDQLWQETTGRPGYPMSVFVMRNSLLQGHPGTAKALANAYEASLAWVKTHPSEAGVLVEKHDLGLKAAVASAAIPRSAYVFVPAPTARADVEALLAVFLSIAPKSIGGRLPSSDFYAEMAR
jgi:NitT/TauT family transport system substrate-binding protein